jgi:RNA polymerase sigma-70 factor (ECF subfamily)
MFDLPPELEQILRDGWTRAKKEDRQRLLDWLREPVRLRYLAGIAGKRLGLTRADLEDALQEFWVTTVDGVLRNFDPSRLFVPYLITSFINCIQRHGRRVKRRAATEVPYPVLNTPEGTIELEFEDTTPARDPWRLEALTECVNELSPPYRVVVQLFYFEELFVEEIATQLNLSVATVKTRLHRARHALRLCLNRRKCIDDLPASHRQTVVLHELRRKELTEVAVTTGASLEEVRLRLAEGRQLISRCVEERQS